jgi:hypothetical protein
MDEDEVKQKTLKWLKSKDFLVKSEVGVSGIDRDVILDFYAYREKQGKPQILWVEAKGDVPLSQLLEGFIRLEFGVFYGGGQGILAVSHKATQKLLEHKEFLKQAEDVIGILDVQNNRIVELN